MADDIAQKYCPDKTENIVPVAISLALITGSAEETALLAANIGGDSDSVASIGSAIAGALRSESVNESWFEVVNTVNGDAILEIAASLAAMRRHRAASVRSGEKFKGNNYNRSPRRKARQENK